MIRGELVNLRAVERTDAGLIWGWLNDPSVMRGWGLADATVSLAEVQRRVEGWLVDEAEEGRPVAFIVEHLEGDDVGLLLVSRSNWPARSVELSLLIGNVQRWGEGIGADAVTSAVDACFAQWNLHRVWLRVEADNDRAHRLYRGRGFVHEATLRQASFVDGVYHDLLVYARLATDPAP